MEHDHEKNVNAWKVLALALLVVLAGVAGGFFVLRDGGAGSGRKDPVAVSSASDSSGESGTADEAGDSQTEAVAAQNNSDTTEEAAAEATENAPDADKPVTFDGKTHNVDITFADGMYYERIAGTTVYLMEGFNNPAGKPVKTLTTDKNGRLNVKLPAGEYTLVWGDNRYYDGMENLIIGGDGGPAANFIHDADAGDSYTFWKFLLPRQGGNTICMILEWKGKEDLDLCVFNAKERRYISSVQPADNSGAFLVDDDWEGSPGWEVVVIKDHTKSEIYTPYIRDGRSLVNGSLSAMESNGVRLSVVDHNGLMFSQQADPSEHAALWMPCYLYKGKVIKDTVYEYDPAKYAWAAYRKQ